MASQKTYCPSKSIITCCNQFTHVAFLPRMLITGDNQEDAECHMFFKTTSLDCSVS